MFVCPSDSFGRITLLVPFNPVQGSSYICQALSSFYPAQVAYRSVQLQPSTPLATTALIFRVPDFGNGGPDTTPPTIAANPPGQVLPTNQTVTIHSLVTDNVGLPACDLPPVLVQDIKSSYTVLADGTPAPLDQSKVTMSTGAVQQTGPTSILQPVDFVVTTQAVVTVTVTAHSASGVSQTTPFTFAFGPLPASPPGAIKSADPSDTTPPQVVWTLPPQGAVLDWDSPVLVRFSKAMDTSTIPPSGGSGTTLCQSDAANPSLLPLQIQVSADQLSATIYPAALQPGTSYTLTVNNSVKDLNGNGLNQDPTKASAVPFRLQFKTPPAAVASLPSLGHPVSTLVFGTNAFTLDSAAPNVGPALVVHRLGQFPSVLSTIPLAHSEPRMMTLIPAYRFARDYSSPSQIQTNPILVTIGGTIGTGGDGQWIKLFNISDPGNVASLGVAVLTWDQDSSAANVKFSAPDLFVHIYGPGGSYIQMIDLQALILGCGLPYDTSQWNNLTPKPALSYTMIPGVDTNYDGDYADPGETLPIPQKFGLFGLFNTIQGGQNCDFTDFDVQQGEDGWTCARR